jgi:homoserine O-acetyltransferase
VFFTAAENKETYERLKHIKSDIYYDEIDSIHGHDAFLIEYEQLSVLLKNIFQVQKTSI